MGLPGELIVRWLMTPSDASPYCSGEWMTSAPAHQDVVTRGRGMGPIGPRSPLPDQPRAVSTEWFMTPSGKGYCSTAAGGRMTRSARKDWATYGSGTAANGSFHPRPGHDITVRRWLLTHIAGRRWCLAEGSTGIVA